tara:strand:- start:1518 stop:1748 length:231 start_codon:yes stop_codon:yes gene_type:complete
MESNNNNQNMDLKLKDVGKKLDELLAVCDKLKEENLSLKQQQNKLIEDRANLLQKNDQVRVRVEAMISRLKAMEQA